MRKGKEELKKKLAQDAPAAFHFSSLISPLVNTLFPTTCAACGEVLMNGERQLCLSCIASLSEHRDSELAGTAAERLLGHLPLQAAMSQYLFRPAGTVQAVVHAMKFRSGSELCLLMGRQLGLELLRSGRFDDVDVLVPIPLHWRRRMKRGYNQSELLCRGIAEVMPRPVVTGAVVRHRYTHEQSRQPGALRASNVEGAFKMKKPGRLTGLHVLLVDDVLTTGATLTACSDVLLTVPGLRLSIATLCSV